MNLMIVYPACIGNASPRIEVAYRGIMQALPGGSIAFESEGELRRALVRVAENLEWTLPEEFLGRVGKIYRDVRSGLGWDFHLSTRSTSINLSEGKQVVVYRHEVNSAL